MTLVKIQSITISLLFGLAVAAFPLLRSYYSYQNALDNSISAWNMRDALISTRLAHMEWLKKCGHDAYRILEHQQALAEDQMDLEMLRQEKDELLNYTFIQKLLQGGRASDLAQISKTITTLDLLKVTSRASLGMESLDDQLR